MGLIKVYSERRRYTATIIFTVFTSSLLAYLEYYFVHIDNLPAREATTPIMGPLYSYQVAVFLPLIILVAFQSLIQDWLLKIRVDVLRTTVPLGVASTILGVVLVDALWFLFRFTAPVVNDPLAGYWIRAFDYTAVAVGSTQILGATIPLWYFAAAPIIIAIYAALLMLPAED